MAHGSRTDGPQDQRRFILILAVRTLACAGLFAQAKASAPKTRLFTDNDFGFSFRYPAHWKVAEEPVNDPTADGWFPGATIVKQFKIHNPAALADDSQPPGVVLLEILAPGGLIELGHSKSASPVGVDQKYFFDSRTHRWIYAQLSIAPSGAPPSTYPAPVRHRTIGGLPIFWGAYRHGGEQIVPLNGSHFLAISTMDVGGDDSHVHLAATVVATHHQP